VIKNSNVQVNGSLSVGSATLTLQGSHLNVSGGLFFNDSSSLILSATKAGASPEIMSAGDVTLAGTVEVDFTSASLTGSDQSFLLLSGSNITGHFENVLFQFPSSSDCSSYSGTPVYGASSFSVLVTEHSSCGAPILLDWQIGLIVGLVAGAMLIAGLAVFMLRKHSRKKSHRIMMRKLHNVTSQEL